MASCKTLGYVHSLESFGSVDGPGVRFVVFLQGCALRCKYCHNPETWAEGGEEWTAEALFQRVYRYRNYWGKKGGITVSGGEPLRASKKGGRPGGGGGAAAAAGLSDRVLHAGTRQGRAHGAGHRRAAFPPG